MGGKIWMESEPGIGSIFHFTMRLPRHAVKGGNAFTPKPPVKGMRAPVADDNETKRLIRPLKLLLAEDNRINRRVIIGMLKKRGHSVVAANNGRETLEALEEETFDALITDVQMTEMDGFESTMEIRRREKVTGQHLYIIALTAHSMKGDCERCLAVGMDAYLSKPIRSPDLEAALIEIPLTKPAKVKLDHDRICQVDEERAD